MIELRNAELYTDQNTGDKKLLLYFNSDKGESRIWVDLLVNDSADELARKFNGLAKELIEGPYVH
jgi:hypothetical protein